MFDPQSAKATAAQGHAAVAPGEFLIGHVRHACQECWGCVRHCPSRAIRVTEGRRSAIIEDRCVKCGICVTSCGNAAHAVRDDLPRVRALLASGRPVVALLASEAPAGLYPTPFAEVERQLESMGFDGVETTVLGEELVAAAYEQTHERVGSGLPQIRSTCPVVVSWVRRFYPQLVGALAPIAPPYIATARLIKSVYPPDTAVVYVSPCWARKDEAFEPEVAGAVDVAVGFDELKRFLAEAPPRPEPFAGLPRSLTRRDLSLTDGFPRRTLTKRDMTDRDVVIVRGLDELDRLLKGILSGETAPAVVDALLCEGCADGPAIDTPLSVFARRSVIATDEARRPVPEVDTRAVLAGLPAVDLLRSFAAVPVDRREPTEGEVDAALAEAEFTRANTIDCGACGYDTCIEQAAAVSLGHSTWDVCFPMQRKRLEKETARLEEMATIDRLTGLINRRGFDDRIAEEIARAQRYGTRLSLLMADLDAFKRVNDAFGHPAGDSVLTTAGMLLREAVRATDISVRYGGDEFAILLPDTDKTEAFLVAEKLRDTFARARIPLDAGIEAAVTISIGVAALSETEPDSDELVSAADAALYRAKQWGRNRVELAQG